MWHTIWDVPVFAGIKDKIAEIQDKIKDSLTLPSFILLNSSKIGQVLYF